MAIINTTISKRLFAIFILFILIGCSNKWHMNMPYPNASTTKGSEFVQTILTATYPKRDSLATAAIISGQTPSFIWKFTAIHVSITDSIGKTIHAVYYVSPDYLAIGTNNDFFRMPLTPMAAQQIADQLHCFLPTRKMVNDIYEQATIKLAPLPLLAYRDSSITFWHHHLMIEGQRNGRKGLIAGIKKDVVLTDKLNETNNKKVAIYGWHQLNGKPIQPLYTGHVNWYTDYSHGIRLVYEKIKVNGKWKHYTDIMKDPVLKKILCDEVQCNMYRYQ